MNPKRHETPPLPTLRGYFREALRQANAWRPVSFYFLLAIPVVMVLGAQMFRFEDNPARFALILSLIFIFFGVVLLRAVMDLFEISRRSLREHRNAWVETLGDAGFIEELGDRVRREEAKQADPLA